MNKVLRLLSWLLTYPIRSGVVQAAKHIERNINRAPDCCGKPMEYLGEHSGFYLNTQIYQCQECKRVEILHLREGGNSEKSKSSVLM